MSRKRENTLNKKRPGDYGRLSLFDFKERERGLIITALYCVCVCVCVCVCERGRMNGCFIM